MAKELQHPVNNPGKEAEATKANVSVHDEIDLSTLTQVTKAFASSAGLGGGKSIDSFSVVNSKGNGRRVAVSKSLRQKLELDGEMQVAAKGDELIIGKIVPGATEVYKSSGDHGIYYCYDLVHFITNTFKLDYSQRTSISFGKVIIKEQKYQDKIYKLAYVTMKKE